MFQAVQVMLSASSSQPLHIIWGIPKLHAVCVSPLIGTWVLDL